jgi:hypothetical protein
VALTRLMEIEKANGLLASIFADVNPRLWEKGGPLLIEQLTKRLLAVADKLDAEAIRDPLTWAPRSTILVSTAKRSTCIRPPGERGRSSSA